MTLFVATTEQAAPLQIQLGTTASVGCEVRSWSAWAESPVGSTSRPILYRPSQPGVGRQSDEKLRIANMAGTREETVIEMLTQFSKSPTYPDVPMIRTNWPIRLSVAFPPKQGFVILPGPNYGMLYARTDFTGQPKTQADQNTVAQKGGYQWNATLLFEQL